MRTASELEATERQKKAQWLYLASRARISEGRLRLAADLQNEASHYYCRARGWMGVTNGDVKKAQTCA